MEDIGQKVVFDGQSSDQMPWGSKITCELSHPSERAHQLMQRPDWIDKVIVAKPLVPEKDKLAVERRIFPTEVSA